MSTTIKTENIAEQYKQVQEDVRESVHKVWLAGLGAYSVVEEESGKLFDNLVERGRKLEKEGNKLFSGLVDRGRKVESKGKKEVKKAQQKATTTFDDLQDEMEERFAKVVQRLGLPNRSLIQDLAKRVEELTEKVDAVQGAPTPRGGRRVFHLVPDGEGWSLKAEGNPAALSQHPTKDEALAAGRELAQSREPSQLVVHRMDGTVQTAYTYGEQPADA